VQQSVVIELDERLERDAELPAIIQHGMMVIGNPPRPRIEIVALFEFAGLARAAELGEAITAAQCPVASAGPAVEFQHLYLVAGLVQFQRGRHAGEARAKHQHRCAPGIAIELDRAAIAGLRSKAEAGHGLIHRSAAGDRSHHRQEVAPGCNGVARVLHVGPLGLSRPGADSAFLLQQRPAHPAHKRANARRERDTALGLCHSCNNVPLGPILRDLSAFQRDLSTAEGILSLGRVQRADRALDHCEDPTRRMRRFTVV
jgi:hypothetical protein